LWKGRRKSEEEEKSMQVLWAAMSYAKGAGKNQQQEHPSQQ